MTGYWPDSHGQAVGEGHDHQEQGCVQLGGVCWTANCRRPPPPGWHGCALAAAVPWVSLLNPTCKGRSTRSAPGVEDTALVGQQGQIKASPNPKRSPCACSWAAGVLRPPFLPCQSRAAPPPGSSGNRGARLDILSSSSGSPVDCKFEFVLK